jgi:hypothetical protein
MSRQIQSAPGSDSYILTIASKIACILRYEAMSERNVTVAYWGPRRVNHPQECQPHS